MTFLTDATRLLTRCTKPDRTEFTKVAKNSLVGFFIIGFIGVIVKITFIPIHNIMSQA